MFRKVYYVPIVSKEGDNFYPVALSYFHLFHLDVHNILQLADIVSNLEYDGSNCIVLEDLIIFMIL